MNEYIVSVNDSGKFATIEPLTRCEKCKYKREEEDSKLIARCALFGKFTELSNFCRYGAPNE